MAKRNLASGDAIPMEAGERNRRVLIQQLTDSQGDSGYPIETWSTLAIEWMRKMDLSLAERFKASQLAASVETQWEMPYRSDMDPELVDVQKTRRLLYENRVYDITGGSVIGRREGIELLTLAGSGLE
jgi:SPP1 family predicted phage head-tail adaptor